MVRWSSKLSNRIRIPNNWRERPHQSALWRFLHGGGKRAVAVWHRRAGKDSTGLNYTACAAHERVGLYWHMLPTQKQARKVVWDRIDRDTGRKALDVIFPPAIRAKKNETEMKIELKCGSIWQLCGSDNYDALVGGDPIGVVFSEFSLTNPAAWDFVRPILAENGGWALFIYTPRGRNHGYRLFKAAQRMDGWFSEMLTVDDTQREDGSPIIALESIEEDRASGMAEEMIEQEYWCSFEAALVGSYYGTQLKTARQEGRIGFVPHRADVPVNTAWDIGYGDSTAIWFYQQIGDEIGLVDYEEDHGKGVDHYVKLIDGKPYVYGKNYGPHDLSHHEWGSGKSRRKQAKDLGLEFHVLPKLGVDDGINAARAIFPRCRFDETKCEKGIDALTMYRKEWDEDKQMFGDKPLHDWSSHGADAFRYLALAIKDTYFAPEPKSGRASSGREGGWLGG